MYGLYRSHQAHATFGSINVRKCQIKKERLHKSIALTLDSFSSESLVCPPFSFPRCSSFLASKEFERARQKDFSCSFIVDRLGNRFPQNWQARNTDRNLDFQTAFESCFGPGSAPKWPDGPVSRYLKIGPSLGQIFQRPRKAIFGKRPMPEWPERPIRHFCEKPRV